MKGSLFKRSVNSIKKTLGSTIEGVPRETDAAGGKVRQRASSFRKVADSLPKAKMRLGVTGLSQSGKTVYMTSLVTNLLECGKSDGRDQPRIMPGLEVANQGRIANAMLVPQRDYTIPRFDYEAHRARLSASPPEWPKSTRGISYLRLSLETRASRANRGLRAIRSKTFRRDIDIVDYPGEWLLDLTLMEKSYAEWSQQVLERMRNRDFGEPYLQHVKGLKLSQEFDDVTAKKLAALFTDYLKAAQERGYSDLTPGRFLLPGEKAGAPVLTFAPLPMLDDAGKVSLWREMNRRYKEYKKKIVRPFFKNHFSDINCQIVLVDLLSALQKGPQSVRELRETIVELLGVFREGRNSRLRRLLFRSKVERVLFAATCADQLHHSLHDRYSRCLEEILEDAISRTKYKGAKTKVISLASIRCTTELPHDGKHFVQGILLDTRESKGVNFERLVPDDIRSFMLKKDYEAERRLVQFAPPWEIYRPGCGIQHIRLGTAAQFLFGEHL